MNLDLRDGLLFVSLRLTYKGKAHMVNNIILDTGAAHSLIDRSAVESLNLATDDDDIIVTMTGISGNDYAVRKQIESITFGMQSFEGPYLDFGNLDAHPGINGLLGADILVRGRFIIDLNGMAIYQR